MSRGTAIFAAARRADQRVTTWHSRLFKAALQLARVVVLAVFRSAVVVLLLICGTMPANAKTTITVSYSAPADLYSIMDNVSGWLDGFVISAYREEWVRRFGWSADDQKWVDRYREYRTRTFLVDTPDPDPLTTPDGIFASRNENVAGADPLATYFLGRPTIENALATLGRFASPDDARMLKLFYRHFEPKWRILLSESPPLLAKARALQQHLDGAGTGSFVQRVGAFYRSRIDGEYKVFFVRYPPGKRSSAEPVGGNFILLHAPTAGAADEGDWDTIVMHELVHYISSRQPESQKRDLTKLFLSRCKLPDGAKKLWLIEEPLAVAWGQTAYSAKVLSRPLDPSDNWYAIPWVNTVARTIAPSILKAYGGGGTLDSKIIDQAADRCNDLVAVAAALHARE